MIKVTKINYNAVLLFVSILLRYQCSWERYRDGAPVYLLNNAENRGARSSRVDNSSQYLLCYMAALLCSSKKYSTLINLFT